MEEKVAGWGALIQEGGDIYMPVADSCGCMQKPTQYRKRNYLPPKNKSIRKHSEVHSDASRREAAWSLKDLGQSLPCFPKLSARPTSVCRPSIGVRRERTKK